MASARAVVVLGALIGCASPKPNDFLGTPIPRGCEEGAKTSESDRCVGFWFDQVLRLLGTRTYEDPAIRAYVTSVGQRLARAANDRRPWRFEVLDDPEVQAFVTLGSIVYINRGTLAVLRNEAELAAVLAHEMGHLRGGHAREKIDEVGREAMRSDVEKTLAHKYARDDEIQADESAVLLVTRAGYDGRAVESMLRALAGHTHDGVAVENPAAIHPWWPERVARAQAIVRPGGALHAERYRAGVASLIAGDDPRRIAVVGNALIFAHAELALDLPPHRDATLGGDSFRASLEDGSRLDISLLSEVMMELVAAAAAENKLAMETQTSHGWGITLAVRDAADAEARAKRLHATFRKPRADELARLITRRVDLAAPRRMWKD
jgi:hypothetical protein